MLFYKEANKNNKSTMVVSLSHSGLVVDFQRGVPPKESCKWHPWTLSHSVFIRAQRALPLFNEAEIPTTRALGTLSWLIRKANTLKDENRGSVLLVWEEEAVYHAPLVRCEALIASC